MVEVVKVSKIILSDFDGTITVEDTLVKILDTFAGPKWRRIEEGIKREEFGSRIGLRKEFDLCNPTKKQIVDLLNEEIEIDSAFKPFLEFCNRDGYELTIVSGGFSLCIETILKKYNISGIPYFANMLDFKNGKLEIKYPYSTQECKVCGNCKTMHLKRFKSQGHLVIYIGDSTTDRCPAKFADLVFAKGELEDYCTENKIPFVSYNSFADIKDCLTQQMILDVQDYTQLHI